MVNDRVELWGAGTARTHRTLWMAHELGLDFRHVPIGPRTGETKEPAFLALNPRHKVPVLRHGDLVLTESAAILQRCDGPKRKSSGSGAGSAPERSSSSSVSAVRSRIRWLSRSKSRPRDSELRCSKPNGCSEPSGTKTSSRC